MNAFSSCTLWRFAKTGGIPIVEKMISINKQLKSWRKMSPQKLPVWQAAPTALGVWEWEGRAISPGAGASAPQSTKRPLPWSSKCFPRGQAPALLELRLNFGVSGNDGDAGTRRPGAPCVWTGLWGSPPAPAAAGLRGTQPP